MQSGLILRFSTWKRERKGRLWRPIHSHEVRGELPLLGDPG